MKLRLARRVLKRSPMAPEPVQDLEEWAQPPRSMTMDDMMPGGGTWRRWSTWVRVVRRLRKTLRRSSRKAR